MKKAILLITLTLVLLSGCQLQPDTSDEEMATRVAQILTQEYIAPAQTEMVPPEIIFPTVTAEAEELAEGIVVVTATPTVTLPAFTPTETEPPAPSPTDTPEPTLTPEPTSTPPATDPAVVLGQPSSTDPMDSADLWHWPTGQQEYTAITFKDGFMEFTGLKTAAGWRLPMAPAATDIYIEMTVRTGECSADDSYGIIFRIPVFNEADRGYLFSISCDGFYRLTKWDGKAGTSGQGWRLLDWRASAYINPGANQVNRIGVMTNGDRFYLYANGYLLNDSFILQDTDNPYPGGHFGVFVTAKNTLNFTIYVDQMRYWLNSFKP